MAPTASSLALDGLTSSLPSTTLKRSVLACSPGSPRVQDFSLKTCSGKEQRGAAADAQQTARR